MYLSVHVVHVLSHIVTLVYLIMYMLCFSYTLTVQLTY